MTAQFITIKTLLVPSVIQASLMILLLANVKLPLNLESHAQKLFKLAPQSFVSPVQLATLLSTTDVYPLLLHAHLMTSTKFVPLVFLVINWSTTNVFKFLPIVTLSTKMVNVFHVNLALRSTPIKDVQFLLKTHVPVV